MDLSVVVPVYNEEESLGELVAELRDALDPTGLSYEVVCVDDGSSDRSFEVLTELSREHSMLVVCRFRRNFGQTAAMQAGLDAARGAVVATLDADLQNDAHDIPAMVEKLDEGYDLIAGWRAKRKDTFINRRLPSILANRLISSTTSVRLHDYGCTLKVMRAEVAKELRLYGEMHRFIPVMAALVGARICEMPVNHRARKFGTSKYGIGRTTRVVLDLLTVLFLQSYLARPMQVFGLGGLMLGGLGFLISGWLAIEKLFFGAQLANRPLLLLGALLLLVGVQLVSLGLVADVLGRTYHEAQGKPPYYVREWVRGGNAEPAQPNASASARPPVTAGPA
ncbi:MAG: glycosyltransferase family 2 protein [Myxococcales bacterium]